MIQKNTKIAYSLLEVIFVLIVVLLGVYMINANPFLKEYFSNMLSSDKTQTQSDETQNRHSNRLKDLNTYIARTKVAVADVFQTLQLLRNKEDSSVDFSSEGLMKYFQTVMQAQIISHNKIVTQNGMIFTFVGDGDCMDGSCYIEIDTNGEAGPNKKWENPEEPNDIIILPVTNKNGAMSIEPPSFYNDF